MLTRNLILAAAFVVAAIGLAGYVHGAENPYDRYLYRFKPGFKRMPDGYQDPRSWQPRRRGPSDHRYRTRDCVMVDDPYTGRVRCQR